MNPPAPYAQTEKEWENIRPILTKLYLNEQKKLKDVVLILEREHGFKATERMFKARINRWNLRKYKKRDANEADLEDRPPKRTRPDSRSSASGSTEDIGTGQRISTGIMQNPPSDRLISGDDVDENKTILVKWNPPSIPFNSGSVEATLQYTRVYLDWALEQGPDTEAAEPLQFAYNLQNLQGGPQALDGAVATRESIWYKFHYGLGLLERKRYDDAFSVLDAGCDTVRRFIRKPPRLFFQSLFMVLGSERWTQFPPIQLHLLTFLAGMASRTVGISHPISLMLKQLSNEHMIEQTAEAMLRGTLHAFEKALGSGSPEVLRLKRTLCTVLQRQKDYLPCETVIRAACVDSEITNGIEHVETRRCLRRLGYLYMELERYSETINICEEVISRQPQLAQGADPDEFTICTYQNLAVACECLGQHNESENWLLKSVNGARRKWGMHGAFSFEDFDGLKDMVYDENKSRTCIGDAAHNQGLLRKVRNRILDRQAVEQECDGCGQERCESHSHLARIAENRF